MSAFEGVASTREDYEEQGKERLAQAKMFT